MSGIFCGITCTHTHSISIRTAQGNAELRRQRPAIIHMSPHMSPHMPTHIPRTCLYTGSTWIRTKLERGPISGCHFTCRSYTSIYTHVHVCTASMHMVTHMSCTLSNHMSMHMSTTMFANMSIQSYIDYSCIFFLLLGKARKLYFSLCLYFFAILFCVTYLTFFIAKFFLSQNSKSH